jgi:hypothetical protein
MATQSIQSIITSTLNKGDKGDTGTKGEKGVLIASASYNLANDTVTFTNSDSTTLDLTGIKGAKGNIGDKGTTGDIGAKGDKGPIGDLTAITGISEAFTALSGATGTVTHDTSLGTVFYHTGQTANFTANFTNVSTTDGRTTVVVLFVVQGGTAYMPTSVQINGSAVTIKWSGGSAPSGTANGINVVGFTLLRNSGTWTVIGQSSSFV